MFCARAGVVRRPSLQRVLSCGFSTLRPRSAAAVLRPRPHEGEWISDAPRLLPFSVQAMLNERMSALDDSGRGQFAIAILDDIAGDGGSRLIGGVDSYGQFTELLFDEWGVGNARTNDGVLMAIFLEGRRMEVRTGKGARPVLPDAWLERMLQRDMVPLFRQGQPEAGIERGALLILDRLEGLEPIVAQEVDGGKLAVVPRQGEPAAFGDGRVARRPSAVATRRGRHPAGEGSPLHVETAVLQCPSAPRAAFGSRRLLSFTPEDRAAARSL